MIANRKRNLIAIGILLTVVTFLACTAWVADRTIAWINDLPNRIEFDRDAFMEVATQSARAGLHASDSETQLQSIKSLLDGASQNGEILGWIRDEYTDDLRALSASEDVVVATKAAALLALTENSD